MIAIAAGGTGGHFFPAEALAAELKRRGYVITLFTDARSGGEKSQVFADCQRYILPVSGIAGRGLGRSISALLSIASAALHTRKILRRVRPAAIIGFGGYPSVAPVLASRLIAPKPKVILHEQNAVMGRANRKLAGYANAIALSFAETAGLPKKARGKTVQTGNPVRTAIADMAWRGYLPATDRFRLLVLGGSQGAKLFSSLIPETVSMLPENLSAKLDLALQCRADQIASTRVLCDELGVKAEISAFFHDIADRISQAHLVIARAGASTVAELAAIGRPSILIPLPSAIDDHQRANAMALANAGGAWMMDQSGLFPGDLAEFLTPLLGRPQELAPLAEAAAGFGHTDAAARLADLVERMIRQKDAR